jgi:hypothetical protein
MKNVPVDDDGFKVRTQGVIRSRPSLTLSSFSNSFTTNSPASCPLLDPSIR